MAIRKKSRGLELETELDAGKSWMYRSQIKLDQ